MAHQEDVGRPLHDDPGQLYRVPGVGDASYAASPHVPPPHDGRVHGYVALEVKG